MQRSDDLQDFGRGLEFGTRTLGGPLERPAADEGAAARLFVKRPLSGEVSKCNIRHLIDQGL